MTYDLTDLTNDVVVFEIDDNTLHGHARFTRAMDTLRATGKLKDPVEHGWGGWLGGMSPCYVMSMRDVAANDDIFQVHTAGQDAFMCVRSGGAVDMLYRDGRVDPPMTIMKTTHVNLTTTDGFTLLRSGAYVAL